MYIFYQMLILLFHLLVHIMSSQDLCITARQECLTMFRENGHFIKYGDDVVLYNVYHESAITSLKDDSSKFGSTGYVPGISNIKLNQSKLEEALAFHPSPQRNEMFAVFKILPVGRHRRKKVHNGDKIYLQYTHATIPKDVFLGVNATSQSQCIYTFNHGNGFTVHQNVSELRHGSEIELSGVSDIDSRIWASNIGAHKLLQSKHQDGKQRWKIFVTDSTLDLWTIITLMRQRNNYKRVADRLHSHLNITKQEFSNVKADLTAKLSTADRNIVDIQNQTKKQLREANQRFDTMNKTLQQMTFEAGQMLFDMKDDFSKLHQDIIQQIANQTHQSAAQITQLKSSLNNTTRISNQAFEANFSAINDEKMRHQPQLSVANQTAVDQAHQMSQMIVDQNQKIAQLQNHIQQIVFEVNKTIEDMRLQTHQITIKLNASENNTMKQEKQFEQQLYQLNQTLLQSESDYQMNLQTRQTTIDNLTQQTRNLETVVMGSLLAFGILSVAFLITCIRNANKTNEQKLILKSIKRNVVTAQVSHDNGVRAKLSSIGERSPEDYEKDKKQSINEHGINNVVFGETDVGLDVVQDMINNHVKPSFMVRTQDRS